MPKPLKNNTHYEEALGRIFELMQKTLEPKSKESNELEMLSTLVKEYELEHHPIPKPYTR